MNATQTKAAAAVANLKPVAEMTPHQIISARILTLVAAGADVAEATDAICGQGTFKKLAADTYNALRKKM